MSNHINDTPRTDAEEYESQDEPITKLGSVDAEFARSLERHLNGANDLIVRLQAITNDPHALWINWLRGSVGLPVGIGDVREYQDRIKRLEEAGDALYEGWIGYGFTKDKHLAAWRKAKDSQ